MHVATVNSSIAFSCGPLLWTILCCGQWPRPPFYLFSKHTFLNFSLGWHMRTHPEYIVGEAHRKCLSVFIKVAVVFLHVRFVLWNDEKIWTFTKTTTQPLFNNSWLPEHQYVLLTTVLGSPPLKQVEGFWRLIYKISGQNWSRLLLYIHAAFIFSTPTRSSKIGNKYVHSFRLHGRRYLHDEFCRRRINMTCCPYFPDFVRHLKKATLPPKASKLHSPVREHLSILGMKRNAYGNIGPGSTNTKVVLPRKEDRLDQ